MMKALVKKPAANGSKPLLNSCSKPPSLPTMSAKSSSASKPQFHKKQSETITKAVVPKDLGMLKRTSVSKPTKK